MAGTVRSEGKAKALQAEGIDAACGTGRARCTCPIMHCILVTIPPDAHGCPVLRHVHTGPGHDYNGPGHDHAGLRHDYTGPIHDFPVTYLSTTGVYGDLAGGWAFEWSETNPQSRRAKARVLAEDQWRAATGGQVNIVRLPGIYGPGRSAFDRLRDGTARRIVKPGQVFSRVHVDDIAGAFWRCTSISRRPRGQGRVSSLRRRSRPAAGRDCLRRAIAGHSPAAGSGVRGRRPQPMAASFYAECKRVSNARTKPPSNGARNTRLTAKGSRRFWRVRADQVAEGTGASIVDRAARHSIRPTTHMARKMA